MTKKALGRGLPDHIKDNEMKAQFKRIIEAWRKDGYNVSRLEGMMDLDFDTLSQAFTLFDNDVKNLNDLAEIVNLMETKGFEAEIKSIRSKLKNPDLIMEVLQEVHELDKKLKNAREKDQQAYKVVVEKKIGEWSAGHQTMKTELMDLWEQSEQEAMVKDPKAVEAARAQVEKKMDDNLEDRLSVIKSRLSKLNLDKTVQLRSDKINIPDEPKKEPEGTKVIRTTLIPIQKRVQKVPEAKEESIVKPEPNAEARPSEIVATTDTKHVQNSMAMEIENSDKIQIEPEQTVEKIPSAEPPEASETVQPNGALEPNSIPESKPSQQASNLTHQQKEELEDVMNLAKEMYRKKEFGKAIEYFNMALEIDSMNSDAIFFKKRAEARLNEH